MSTNNELSIDDKGLEKLLQEALVGARNDIDEVEQNVEWYKQQIAPSGNLAPIKLEQLGELFNDALRTKGMARAQLVKLIGMVQQRIKTKEGAAKPDEGMFMKLKPSQILSMIETAQKKAKDE